jgi:hypothetical protein
LDGGKHPIHPSELYLAVLSNATKKSSSYNRDNIEGQDGNDKLPAPKAKRFLQYKEATLLTMHHQMASHSKAF